MRRPATDRAATEAEMVHGHRQFEPTRRRWQDRDGKVHKEKVRLELNARQPIGRLGKPEEIAKKALEKVEAVKNFFREARAYLQETAHSTTNLKLEAVKGLQDCPTDITGDGVTNNVDFLQLLGLPRASRRYEFELGSKEREATLGAASF